MLPALCAIFLDSYTMVAQDPDYNGELYPIVISILDYYMFCRLRCPNEFKDAAIGRLQVMYKQPSVKLGNLCHGLSRSQSTSINEQTQPLTGMTGMYVTDMIA